MQMQVVKQSLHIVESETPQCTYEILSAGFFMHVHTNILLSHARQKQIFTSVFGRGILKFLMHLEMTKFEKMHFGNPKFSNSLIQNMLEKGGSGRVKIRVNCRWF